MKRATQQRIPIPSKYFNQQRQSIYPINGSLFHNEESDPCTHGLWKHLNLYKCTRNKCALRKSEWIRTNRSFSSGRELHRWSTWSNNLSVKVEKNYTYTCYVLYRNILDCRWKLKIMAQSTAAYDEDSAYPNWSVARCARRTSSLRAVQPQWFLSHLHVYASCAIFHHRRLDRRV